MIQLSGIWNTIDFFYESALSSSSLPFYVQENNLPKQNMFPSTNYLPPTYLYQSKYLPISPYVRWDIAIYDLGEKTSTSLRHNPLRLLPCKGRWPSPWVKKKTIGPRLVPFILKKPTQLVMFGLLRCSFWTQGSQNYIQVLHPNFSSKCIFFS